MDKVLVEIFVPVLERTFDVFIPLHSPMHEVLGLVKKAIKEMSDGRFKNINLSVYELEIKNGSKLMLI